MKKLLEVIENEKQSANERIKTAQRKSQETFSQYEEKCQHILKDLKEKYQDVSLNIDQIVAKMDVQSFTEILKQYED